MSHCVFDIYPKYGLIDLNRTNMNIISNPKRVFSTVLIPRQLVDFAEIKDTAQLTQDGSFFFQNNGHARESFFKSPVNTNPLEVTLYYPGNDIVIPVKDFHNIFAQEGLKVISNYTPSFLVDLSHILTENALTSLGIPENVHIVLLSNPEHHIVHMSSGHYCSLELTRNTGYRKFSVTCVYQQWVNYAFLLQDM